jgi:hypothetical protein
MRAAAKAREPYRFGRKVLLVRVASLLRVPLKRLGPELVQLHRDGDIRLVRVDLVQAFDRTPSALRRSLISPATGLPTTSVHNFAAVDLDG